VYIQCTHIFGWRPVGAIQMFNVQTADGVTEHQNYCVYGQGHLTIFDDGQESDGGWIAVHACITYTPTKIR
jgi:hypothetical protein